MKKFNIQSMYIKGLIGACGLLIASLAVAGPIVESRNARPSQTSEPSYSRSSPQTQSNAQLSLPQIEVLEQEIRNLRGQLEVQEHEIKRLSKSQQDYYLDLERKLQKGTAATTASTAAPATANPSSSVAVPPVANIKPVQLAPKPAPKPTVTATRTLPAAPKPGTQKAEAAPARVIYEPIETEAGEEVISSEPIPEANDPNVQLPLTGLPPEKPVAQESTELTKQAKAEAPAEPIKPTLVIKGTVVEKNTYENAYNLVLNKRYPEAVAALKDFLNQYPKGQYAPNAHYWLGEVYTLQARASKNPELLDKASTEFLAITTNFPNHQKAMDALLKLGIIEGDKGNKESAKQYLSTVKERYPGTSVARIAGTHLQKLK